MTIASLAIRVLFTPRSNHVREIFKNGDDRYGAPFNPVCIAQKGFQSNTSNLQTGDKIQQLKRQI